ncbi:MAG: AMP-binding protein [Rhodospirillales bacterium]|nr:AMP-binding protein [Rhodospirillales bacterium]
MNRPAAGNDFLDPILAREKQFPDGLFGACHDGEGWTELTLGAFMRRARCFSRLLREHGLRAGDVMLIVLPHGLDAQAAFIGAMLLGAVPSFMPYPNFKQNEALYWRQHRIVFRHIDPRVILTYAELLAAVGEAVVESRAEIVGAAEVESMAPLEVAPPPGDAVALLQHSSGTTGLKKGVQLGYAAIAAQLAAYADALDFASGASPRIASWLPLYHDMGLITSFLMPLWLGIPVVRGQKKWGSGTARHEAGFRRIGKGLTADTGVFCASESEGAGRVVLPENMRARGWCVDGR